jgi:MYXO-CTERM domain-containing protein
VLFRCLAALGSVLVASSAWASEPVSTSTPYPGVSYRLYASSEPLARVHVVVADLSSSALDLVATREADRGRTVSAQAAATGTQVVINGGLFDPVGFTPSGLAAGDGETWSQSADDAQSGFVSFYRDAERTQVTVSPPEAVVDQLGAEVQGAIAGRPMLVRAGQPVASVACSDLESMPCMAAPRTAIGRSEDGNTLYLVVVDGWQSASAGMTAVQLASFLAELGAYDALMLDGGSASTLFIASEGGLVSSPSDGVERPVANHLALRYGQLPPGHLLGVVKERSVQTGATIPGAQVSLDDGQTVTYSGTGLWSFEVAPRWACVTATAAGYHPASNCRQVGSTEDVYASIALYPDSDFVDAGPTVDAADAGEPADAAPAPPDAELADAGSPAFTDGDGGCATATGAPWWLALVGLAIAATARRRPGKDVPA